MMRLLWIFAMVPLPALADSLVATRTIPAQSVLAAADIALVDAEIPGALTDPDLAVGQEVRVTLYAGRAIHAADLGSAALVARNQTVSLIYQMGSVSILAKGRALARGGAGDVIKVMNSASRTTVSGVVGQDGTVSVSPNSKG